MGGAIQAELRTHPDFFIAGHITSKGADRSVEEHGTPIVVVDFSSPSGCIAAIEFAEKFGYPLVSGTTGLDAAMHDRLDALAQTNAVVHAHNMSQGVQTLLHLVKQAAAALGEWDAELVEIHHHRKEDAPSGTAVSIGHAIAEGRGRGDRDETDWVYGRQGRPGARPDGEIGLHALRGGDVVGEHTAFFFGDGERLELTHRATDRGIFARGALRAARWVVDADNGRYDMQDVLGLK
jgi:4-hydroxy-tetrahydrodipicolinate reductase